MDLNLFKKELKELLKKHKVTLLINVDGYELNNVELRAIDEQWDEHKLIEGYILDYTDL